MKISIIGAGNVGSLTAMRLAEDRAGDILLVDIVKGLARGKCLDLEDSSPLIKYNFNIEGTEDIGKIKDSDIIIITAGLARRPGMAREELLSKNYAIIKGICRHIKTLSSRSIVIVVTNPVDAMTYCAIKETSFPAQRLFGMGISLDASRFANLISRQLNIPNNDIDSCVIGSHGEGMLPLARFTYVKGICLEELLDNAKVDALIRQTINRGAEIVSYLASGSAFFAPSLAIAVIVKAIIKDEKRRIGVSAYLNGEYGVRDVCIGVPALLGRNGIERIIELNLNKEESRTFLESAEQLKAGIATIKKSLPD